MKRSAGDFERGNVVPLVNDPAVMPGAWVLLERPTMKRIIPVSRVVFALLVLGVSTLPRIAAAATSHVFIAQTGVGAANGSDCANAYGVTFFNAAANWGSGPGQIGPGTTVHLCGTFSAPAGASGYLTTQQSGQSRSPVTILFENGAVLTAPYWSGPAILVQHDFITVDGGMGGTIEASQNGTMLAFQQGGASGVTTKGANSVLIQNLTVANLYVRSSATDAHDSAGAVSVDGGNDIQLKNNRVHDMHWALVYNALPGASASNIEIGPGNDIYNVDHGAVLAIGYGTNATITGASIHDNHIHDFANWDNPQDLFHHDAVHVFDFSPSVISQLFVYNNLIDGDWGSYDNAGIYIEGADEGGTIKECGIFNNVFDQTAGGNANGALADYSNSGCLQANNTVFRDALASEFQVSGGSVLYNNVGVSQARLIAGGDGGKISISDYNDFYPAPAVSSNSFIPPGGVCCVDTLAHWTARTGLDAHSLTVDPELSSTYRPMSGSPILGAGKNLYAMCQGQPIPGLGALCLDAAGIPRPSTGGWDMGAYQYCVGAGCTPPAQDAGAVDAGPGPSEAGTADAHELTDGPSVVEGGSGGAGSGSVPTGGNGVSGGCGCRVAHETAGPSGLAALMFAVAATAMGAVRRRSRFLCALTAALLLLLVSSPALAQNDIYIAQSSAGGGNGHDCNDAYPSTFFNTPANWSMSMPAPATYSAIGPGTTVHVCGTFSTGLTFQGSGAAGHPVALLFEPGANFTAPVVPGSTPTTGSSYIQVNGASYVLIDGGMNGLIQNTANGTTLANQNPGSAVSLNAGTAPGSCGHDIEIRSLTVRNMYVRTPNSADYSNGAQGSNGIGGGYCQDNIWIRDNNVGQGHTGIGIGYASTTSSNVRISNNATTDTVWGIVVSTGNTSTSLSDVYIFGNTVTMSRAYCCQPNFHLDGVFVYGQGGTDGVGSVDNVFVYNNHIVGDGGSPSPTAWIYVNQNIHHAYFFNNVLEGTTGGAADGLLTYGISSSDFLITNNTILGQYPAYGDGNALKDYAPIAPPVTIENNLTVNITEAMDVVNSGTPPPFDYNLYWNVCTKFMCGDFGTFNALSYFDHAQAVADGHPAGGDWQGTAIADLHGTYGDPKLASTYPYTLGTGSAAIGVGKNLYGLCNGQPNPGLGALCFDKALLARPSSGGWDVGAYQYCSGGPCEPADGGGIGDGGGVPDAAAGTDGGSRTDASAGGEGGNLLDAAGAFTDASPGIDSGATNAASPSTDSGCSCGVGLGAGAALEGSAGWLLGAVALLRRRRRARGHST